MRAVVIIGEGQILQVVKEILAQVIYNVLAHLGHNHGAQGVKADVHQNGHGQQAAQPQEQLHILVGMAISMACWMSMGPVRPTTLPTALSTRAEIISHL